MFKVSDINCSEKKCMITQENSFSTCLASLPYFDSDGNYHYSDQNYHYSEYKCQHCGRSWTHTRGPDINELKENEKKERLSISNNVVWNYSGNYSGVIS